MVGPRRSRSGCARPGVGRDPDGAAARARSRRGAGPDPALRGQPGHRDAGLPRRGAGRASTQAMRAPFQEGDFPAPVKYGYLNVGVVAAGPAASCSAGPCSACTRTRPRTSCRSTAVSWCRTGSPPARAVLAGTVETAVNALWDAGPLIGDRVTVVGAGMVGCCVARLLARFPGVEVQLVDVDPARAQVAAALGVAFAAPADADGGQDLVVHTSATSAGTAAVAGPARAGGHRAGAQLVRRPRGAAVPRRRVPLGPAGDPRQPGRRGRRRPARTADTPTGCALALDLLRDPAFDALLTGELAVRGAARRCWPGWPPASCRRSATPSPTPRGEAACSA